MEIEKFGELKNNFYLDVEIKQNKLLDLSVKIDEMRSFQSNDRIDRIKADGGNVKAMEDHEVTLEELVLTKDQEALKIDIFKTMGAVQKFILDDKSKLALETKKQLEGKNGRDWMVYAPVKSFSNDILGLLESWNVEDWSMEDTIGLLMDIALTTRSLYEDKEDKYELLSKDLLSARGKVRGTVEKDSTWVKDIKGFGVDPKSGLKSGPSMSAAYTFLFLRIIQKANEPKPDSSQVLEDNKQMESIANGLVLYWKNSRLKQYLGQFHTLAEVWGAYTHHLEKHVFKKIEYPKSF